MRELPRRPVLVVGAGMIDVRVIRGDWPARRALSGYETPGDTSLVSLYNVGDGVRAYGSGGTQSCAETARDVVAGLLGDTVAA